MTDTDEFLIVVESSADFRTASVLAERVLREEGPEWLVDALPHLFRWTGYIEGTDHTDWHDLKNNVSTEFERKGYRLSRVGFKKDGEKTRGEASVRKAIRLAHWLQRKRHRPIRAVVLIQDKDKQPDRKQALERAWTKEESALDFLVVIGVADRCREAWVLNGFLPSGDTERNHLRELQGELGFDPAAEAHRLRNAEKGHPRNPKTVLKRLTGDDHERERRCWEETSLETLRENGKETGLTAYLDEAGELRSIWNAA